MVYNSSYKLCGHAVALSPISGQIIYSRFKDRYYLKEIYTFRKLYSVGYINVV